MSLKNESLHKLLLHIFNQSLEDEIFRDDMKIERIKPLFKKGSDSE